jgi:hypothetical protein
VPWGVVLLVGPHLRTDNNYLSIVLIIQTGRAESNKKGIWRKRVHMAR